AAEDAGRGTGEIGGDQGHQRHPGRAGRPRRRDRHAGPQRSQLKCFVGWAEFHEAHRRSPGGGGGPRGTPATPPEPRIPLPPPPPLRTPRGFLPTGRPTQTVTSSLGTDLRSPVVSGNSFGLVLNWPRDYQFLTLRAKHGRPPTANFLEGIDGVRQVFAACQY